MPITERKATSLSELFLLIHELSRDVKILWYRGHASCDYKLMPSIYRPPYSIKDEEGIMSLFKAKGVKFFANKNSYFEWMFLMQHYGTPTRLLDWSENALVALAFATQYREEKALKDKDAVIWCLDPIKLNEVSRLTTPSSSLKIINICENESVAQMYERGGNVPIAILGSYNSERIIAQKGVFTLFPKTEAFDMEGNSDASMYLWKITIPAENVESIANELYFIGINELSLFPEAESVSKEIKRHFSFEKGGI